MEKLLISACLIGEKCTYKGGDNKISYLEELNAFFDLVPFCPEVEGGLPTPRKPSEIRGSSVYHDDGTDVTRAFHDGAYKATAICSYLGIRLAIMKERSPSCGSHQVHDGYFRNRLIDGEGVTVSALRRMGVTVLNEEEGLEMLEKLKREHAIKDEKTRIAKESEARGKEEVKEPRPNFRKVAGKSFQGKTRPFAKDDKPRGGKPDLDKPRKFGKKPGGKPFSGKPRPMGRKPFKKKPERD